MKAYKATKAMKCIDLTYELGKTYEIDKMEMCSIGFHFCMNMDGVLNYYNFSKDFVLLEVEILGDVITKDVKSVTNKMKILRVIPEEEYTFLENGVIHFKDRYGKEVWSEYDENNNLIHYKDSHVFKDIHGRESWYKYDENNNLIHYKDSNGKEEWYKYDENNNLIHCKNAYVLEEWYKYDENNNLIHYKDSNGKEEWYKYDENNNLIHYKNSYGKEELSECGVEVWREYDENNNLIHFKTSYGKEEWIEYDENNNLIHFKDNRGKEYNITIS